MVTGSTYSDFTIYKKYPEYKHKKLNNRKSLLASVNGRKGNISNLLNSEVITEDEREVVMDILANLELLSLKIKENDENKNKKPVIRFERTRAMFESI